jgi:hypothetical protein
VASSRALFFPPAAFAVFDGEGLFSRCTASSRAFARGLQRWLPTAARSDLRSSQWRQRVLVVIPG